MSVTGADIVAAAREYIGAPYRWWTGEFPEYGPPGYMDYAPNVYTPGFVKNEGVHCAGFVNVVRARCGLDPVGLTRAYEDWMWENGGVWFDPDTPGEAGALCCVGWEPGTAPGVAEGHIAIYTGEHTLIQATPTYGVYEGEMDYDSHAYIGYDVYGLQPDVTYDGVVPDPVIQPVHWVGIGADGVLRLGGDWTNGWYAEDSSGWLRRAG